MKKNKIKKKLNNLKREKGISKKLSKQELKEKVPSIFAKHPAEHLSDRYTYVSTEKIVDYFDDMGWKPIKAFQPKAKKNSVIAQDVKKHLIRFSNPDLAPIMKSEGELNPNILLMNSHNGTSNVFIASGIFRMVCSNGLVIADKMMGSLLKRHSGEKEEIYNAIYQVEKGFTDIWNKVDDYCNVNLTKKQRLEFAQKAIEISWPYGDELITPEDALKPRRVEDEKDSLWTVFNVLQENLMHGGTQYVRPFKGIPKQRKLRAVKNEIRSTEFNKQLWMIMEAFRINRSFN